MKKSAALLLVVFMFLTVFASVAIAADNNSVCAANNAVEVYGPVYNGSNLTDIIARQGSNYAITMDGNNFAAFNYDLNNNMTTESLSVEDIPGTSGRVIGEHRLVYSTKVQQTTCKYTGYNPNDTDWGSYPVIYFFGERYVLLKSNDVNKIAKLVTDSDLKYSLIPGEKLDLGQGYSLHYKQAADNGKVLLELDKDGKYVANTVIALYSDESRTWTCKLNNIQGLNDVPVLKVHVDQVFDSNPASNVVQVQGIWLIDYANSLTLSNGDKLGKLNDVSTNGSILTLSNKDALTLTRGSIQEIGHGLYFKIADSDELRFYVLKEYTDPGTYDLRGQVVSGLQNYNWNASNFAGFYYAPNNNVYTESLSISGINGSVIPENSLRYSTTIKNVEYKYTGYDPNDADWGSYPVIGFFGEKYVPLKSNDVSKIAKVVIDSDYKYSLIPGEKLDLGQGYSLQYKQVGADDRVLLEFDKDGQHVNDAVVRLYGSESRTWTCKVNNIQGSNDIPVMKVHINPIFDSSPVGSVVQVQGIWLIDYANFMTISNGDKFGQLNDVFINGSTLTVSNKDALTLTRDSDQEIAQGLFLKIADSDELRLYPYFQKTTDNAINAITLSKTLTTPAEGTNENYSIAGGETPAVNNTTTEKEQSPGFEIFVAILGLLAVVYILYFKKL
jgi:S-layer protein (TIGR01567 family)